MATGMRLCSPSYHDGGTSWLRNFLNEIDKRGWRCDIVDLHCYWTESHFNDLQKWYNDFHRPFGFPNSFGDHRGVRRESLP